MQRSSNGGSGIPSNKKWVPRQVKVSNILQTEAVKVHDELMGLMDAAKEATAEYKECVEEQKVVVPIVHEDANLAVPDPRIKEKTRPLEDYILAHFVAFGYDAKSLKICLTKLPMWLHMGKIDMTMYNAIQEVYRVYSARRSRLSWSQWLEGLWNDYCYNLPNSWLARVVSGALAAIGVVCFVKKPKTSMVAIGILGLLWWKKRQKPEDGCMRKQLVIIDHCTGTSRVPDIDDEAEVELGSCTRWKCIPREFHVGFSFGVEYAWVPRGCTHNELNALVTRQLQRRLPFDPVEGMRALNFATSLLNKLLPRAEINHPQNSWLDLFLQKYPKNRREAIRREWENNQYLDARVKGFPKIEVMVGKSVPDRKVRFISGFTDGYLAETGPEYYLWQKAMCDQWWSGVEKTLRRLVYTGGMSAEEVGDWFAERIARGLMFWLLDMKKFDSRNKSVILAALNEFYKGRITKELLKRLNQSFHKHGSTPSGIKFTVEATMASGRIDTSMGNTIMVFLIVMAIMYMLELPEYDLSALGDDNNSALPENDIPMQRIQEKATLLGHEVEGIIIKPHEYHLIEYCSQRLWNTGSRYVLGPKIGRLLTKTFICHKNVRLSDLEDHIAGVLTGFKHYRWLPVFRVVYDVWFANHPNAKIRPCYKDSNPHRMRLTTDIEVDPYVVDEQFQLVYGFDPWVLEAEIRQWTFPLGACYTHPLIDKLLEVDGVSYEELPIPKSKF